MQYTIPLLLLFTCTSARTTFTVWPDPSSLPPEPKSAKPRDWLEKNQGQWCRNFTENRLALVLIDKTEKTTLIMNFFFPSSFQILRKSAIISVVSEKPSKDQHSMNSDQRSLWGRSSLFLLFYSILSFFLLLFISLPQANHCLRFSPPCLRHQHQIISEDI